MKRILLFLCIFLSTHAASAQNSWIFNRGDSLSWQPWQSWNNNTTITFEKDPSGFFWQNIQNGLYDPVRMPVLNGDGITTWNDPFVQAEKNRYVLSNSESNFFDVVIKYGGNHYLNYKIVGKDSDKYWLESDHYRGEYGAFVFTFGYTANHSDSDYEAQVIFEAEPNFDEPPFDENIDKRGLKDTVNIVTLCESKPDDLVNSVLIRCTQKIIYLPLESPVRFSFVGDEYVMFTGDGFGELKLSVFDIREFGFVETSKSNITTDVSGISSSTGKSNPKVFVNAYLRVCVLPDYLDFGLYGMESGWNTVNGRSVQSLVMETSNSGCKYTFDMKYTDKCWTVVYDNHDIQKFDFEVVKYYDAPQEERDALMDLYHATGGENWTHNDGWGSDLPIDKWYGIGPTYDGRSTPTQMHVSSINLTDNNLIGNLPASLANLSLLGELRISDNNLSGDFPEHPLSEMMNRIEYSWFLDFAGNDFSSTIPEWAQKHPKFKEFWTNFVYQKGNDASVFKGVTIPAPDINLIDLDGNRHTSPGEYTKNKLTIFYYWATWCPFSPGLNKKMIPAYKQYKDAGLNIIGLVDLDERNQPHDTRELVEQYCKEYGITWPNVPLEHDLEGNFCWDNVITPWRFWNEGVIPKVFAVNEKGEVVFESLFYTGYPDIISVIENMFGPIDSEEYYTSTDYSHDGETIKLQSASVDHAIDLVFVGDGFTDKDMESGGLYEQKMYDAMNLFFIEEPYSSLRDRFNVYAVKAVSPNGIFDTDTKHAIDENHDKAFEYAKKALGENADRMMVGVIYNANYAVGRSYTSIFEGDGSFVAYMMDGVSSVLIHEIGGHGIALLMDEYVEEDLENDSPDDEAKAELDELYNRWGRGANIDWRSDPAEVKWAHFLTDSRYAGEGLGVYEGACYGHGAYRPTLNSMMRYNDCGFNAPSREAIYKRVMKLSEGDSWTYDYERFVEFDTPAREVYKKTRAKARAKGNSQQHHIKSRSPKFFKGTWRDAQNH